ncbi:HAMP domain-containing sensor histidine kinase [Ferrimonas pelagia]|uniref:histidine kinase n=1 Tax=Ferrimonas pelagia TaxID=1177826 RepID=A0ABP9FDB0_9GAMM
MRPSPSLIRRGALWGGGILVIVLIGYSVLTGFLMSRGMDMVMYGNARLSHDYIQEEGLEKYQALENLKVFDAVAYDALPSEVIKQYAPSDLSPGGQYKIMLGWTMAPKEVIVVHPGKVGGEKYYLLLRAGEHRVEGAEAIAPGTPARIPPHWRVLGSVSLVVILLGLSLILLARTLLKPVERLFAWARELTPKGLEKPVPEFGYRELDQMAAQIHGNLKEVESAVAREKRFLQHASHELRTPIAVIRGATELMERSMRGAPESQRRPLARIGRASVTMTHLIETLLWLNRAQDRPMPMPVEVDLAALIESLIEEHRYLLQGKPVEICLALDDVRVRVAQTPCRIILANLIRNAMQHTEAGQIRIELSEQGLKIGNQGSLVAETEGFGMGLDLVEQICLRLTWRLTQHAGQDRFTQFLRWPETEAEEEEGS